MLAAAPEPRPDDRRPSPGAASSRRTARDHADQARKLLLVLDHLAQDFEPGRTYPEAEVNEILGGFHDDHAALRRYLVDEAFLAREGGVYWRTGGTVQV